MNEELDAWSWIGKIGEKITFIRLNAIEHRDISEDDYELLKVLYKVYWMGEHPYYQAKMAGENEKTCQSDLFNNSQQ